MWQPMSAPSPRARGTLGQGAARFDCVLCQGRHRSQAAAALEPWQAQCRQGCTRGIRHGNAGARVQSNICYDNVALARQCSASIAMQYTARQREAMQPSVWQCGSRVVHSSAVIEPGTAARALGSSLARQ